ncbi:MAG: GAF domain-containing protein, partial [Nitrospinae bacterium]|nr:GAF domain-containing protein [Nitrospinota bacterium]
TGRPLRTDNYLADSRISRDYLDVVHQAEVVALQIVPIRVASQVEGVLYVINRPSRPFTERDEAILVQLADHAAIAIQNARLYAQAEHRRQVAQSLAEVGNLLSQSLDPVEVGQRIVDNIRSLSQALASVLYRLDPASGDLVALAVSGGEGPLLVPGHVLPARTAAVGLAVHERQVVVTSNSLTDPRLTFAPTTRAGIEQSPFRAILAIPLLLQSRVSGALAIADQAGRVFDEEAIQLAQAFANQAATALENARLYQETHRAYADLARTQAQLIQSQKMEAIGRLAGGVAHDFNNLLTVISGYSEMLLYRIGPGESLRRPAEQIKRSVERTASLIRQLLAFSRRQVLQPKVLDLNFLIADMDKMLRRLIGEDIALVLELDPSLGPVKADPGQLEQVLLNLVINARDAMPQGGQLTVETANVELNETSTPAHVGVRPGLYVRLAVRDTGCGMDAETQSHLFEPFFTTKEPGKGTGLGLATVYGIVMQSGGHIAVDSAPGRGATFTIYLPGIEEAVEAVESNKARSSLMCGEGTVLLVEDETEVRELAHEILEMAGYTVLAAGSGKEALEMCERHTGPIHLLLTDVVMSGMSGPAVAERLTSSRPGMKVLYMSGYAGDAVAQHGVLDPDRTLLQKPFTPDALARKVREVIDAHHAER